MRTFIAAALTGLLVSMASPAQAADTVHSGTYWSWTGPESWQDSQGAYGITILGGSGATLDLGFSTTVCARGSTWKKSVTAYFKAKRKDLQDRGAKLTKVGKIVEVDDMYRRQRVEFSHGTGKKKITGLVIFDYDFTSNVDGVNYCYQRSEARSSRGTAWKRMKSTLADVAASLAYSGPGAFEDPE